MYLRIASHTPMVRNNTSYEAPSFHTSGTPRNVPYTILTHSHISVQQSDLILDDLHVFLHREQRTPGSPRERKIFIP